MSTLKSMEYSTNETQYKVARDSMPTINVGIFVQNSGESMGDSDTNEVRRPLASLVGATDNGSARTSLYRSARSARVHVGNNKAPLFFFGRSN